MEIILLATKTLKQYYEHIQLYYGKDEHNEGTISKYQQKNGKFKKNQVKILESKNKIYELKISLGRLYIRQKHRKEKSVNLKYGNRNHTN